MMIRGLLILLLAVTSFAQTSHVRVEYMKDVKKTKVEADFLYLTNTSDQFLQLQFHAVYKGDSLVKSPEVLGMTIFSLAKRTQYSNDVDLSATTDGEQWKIGTGTRAGMKGESKNGMDSYFSENRPGLGIQVPFPKTARVRNPNGDVNGLVMEWVEIKLKPEQITKLAAAKAIELHLGKNTVAFNDTHLQILKEFAAALTPQP